MPQPAKLAKAEIREIRWNDNQQVTETGKKIKVQFNPQTLAVSFSNQITGTGDGSASARQYVGKGTTTLTLELWFDVTAPSSDGGAQSKTDVRELTREVIFFITPQGEYQKNQYIPPGVRFAWGTFLFDGIITTMGENLEFFSEDGEPLRSKINFSIVQQEIQNRFNPGGAGSGSGFGLGGGIGVGAGIGLSAGIGISGGIGFGAGISAGASIGMAGTQPLVQAQAGVSLQGIAAANGRSSDWKTIALANNIENPRRIEAGTLINANVSGSIKVE